jgi:homogentisate 1,2-dioxygenase
MPVYHKLGEVPRKRHSIFRRPDGGMYAEELMGNKGFVGPSSLLYHTHRPTQVLRVQVFDALTWDREPARAPRHRHFRTRSVSTGASPTTDRVPVLFNRDVALSVVCPRAEDAFFYRNAQGDEVVYVTEGEGVLQSVLGDLTFTAGDYIVIPRGILHRYHLVKGPQRFLVIESAGHVRTPQRYRNEFGQLTESAPYSERDIRRPEALSPREEKGEFRILVKKDNHLSEYVVDHHPFDVVGWDGYYYPWIFNIHDFEPRVGRFHLPPPVHQTFEGDGFVVCSFCPRPFDFDANAVPAPYNHSNVMSDEVLYYANSEFMSRRGIEYASITLHPDGLPHGPHPGRTEASIGQKETNELAVMIDTFRPLYVSKAALDIEDKEYYHSWLGDDSVVD